MAETKEEQFARLHAKFGKKPKDEAEGGGSDNADEEGKEDKPKSTNSKRGRPKKTSADRHQDEIDSGKRTAGRPGTGDFAGRSAKPKPRPKAKPAMLPAPNATRLADKVMADAPPSLSRPDRGPNPASGGFLGDITKIPPPAGPSIGGMPMVSPNPRGSLLSQVLGGFAGGGVGLGQGLGMGPPQRPPLPPLTFEPPPARPPVVGMDAANAAPRPIPVKTTSIPAPDAKKPSPRMPTSASEKESGRPKLKPKKKSTADRMADDMHKDDKTSVNDYYEQLKRGQFNLSK